MPQYPRNLQQRHPAWMAGSERRLKTLEKRTAGIDSGWPLAALPGVVDPAYASGDPSVQINGAVDSSGDPVYTGPYQHLASYTPAAGDSVLLIPVGVNRTYVVLGKLA